MPPLEDLSEETQQPEAAQPDGLTALAEESSGSAEVDGEQPHADDGCGRCRTGVAD